MGRVTHLTEIGLLPAPTTVSCCLGAFTGSTTLLKRWWVQRDSSWSCQLHSLQQESWAERFHICNLRPNKHWGRLSIFLNDMLNLIFWYEIHSKDRTSHLNLSQSCTNLYCDLQLMKLRARITAGNKRHFNCRNVTEHAPDDIAEVVFGSLQMMPNQVEW